MSLNRYRTKQQRPNYLLALIIFVLAVFGLIMIYSASVVASFQHFGYDYFYLNKQAESLVVGIIVWFICAKIDYRFWQKNSFWLFVVTLVLLIAVLIPGLGVKYGGSIRWINLGFFDFQPSELAKLTFTFYLASWLSAKGNEIKDFKKGFLPFILVVAIVSFLIIQEPDMGTMMIMGIVATAIFFASGGSLSHLMFGGLFAFLCSWILIRSSEYRWERFTAFLNPEAAIMQSGYHINQALLAIGSGGLFGLGFGQSKQKFLYLPVPHIDSIYAIVVEELGFLRASLVIIAFIAIGYIGFQIAKNAEDSFGRLVAVGITTWFVAQAFLNIATMIGLVPLTGVPLPFISYGGSALVMSLAGAGILMNISKHCNQ